MPREFAQTQSWRQRISVKSQALFVSIAAFAGLMVPTIIKSTNKAKIANRAKKDLSAAQREYTLAQAAYDQDVENLQEAQARVAGLECAITGYDSYANQLQTVCFTDAPPLEQALTQVESIGLRFYARQDATKQESRYIEVCFDEWLYGHYYTCYSPYCDDDEICCWLLGWHYEENCHDRSYYEYITTIDHFQGTLLERATDQYPLDSQLHCPYYGLSFRLDADLRLVYTSSEIPTIPNHFQVDREWTSYVQSRREVHGVDLVINQDVPKNGLDINMASLGILNFIALHCSESLQSLSDFSIPWLLATQDNINGTIPALEQSVEFSSNHLVLWQGYQRGNQTIYDNAHREYTNTLSLWLPLLFLIPPVVGGLYLLGSMLKAKYYNQYSEYDDLDSSPEEIPRQSPPPYQRF